MVDEFPWLTSYRGGGVTVEERPFRAASRHPDEAFRPQLAKEAKALHIFRAYRRPEGRLFHPGRQLLRHAPKKNGPHAFGMRAISVDCLELTEVVTLVAPR